MQTLRRLFSATLILSLLSTLPALSDEEGRKPPQDKLRDVSTTDHSKLKPLQKAFTSGPEVTAACLQCHTEADDQAMHSLHFTWDYDHPVTGQKLGKRNVINAFCGNVAGNEPRCTSCHAGYGWEDMSQPPPQEETAVDCLVCHDTTGTYSKVATMAGHPPLDPVPEGAKTITGANAVAVDLTKVAQNVGMPGRDNCGNCHFYGGGGDNVKHGDLSSALYTPDKSIDVHMASDGMNFTCSTCHSQQEHSWAGSRYNTAAKDLGGTGKPGGDRFTASCEGCHTATPHENDIVGLKLNDHTDKVACQTCHIPEYAKGGIATKSFWDWSTAGKMNAEGKPYSEENYTQGDGKHLHTYMSKKGDFAWAEDVAPSYAWFNGVVEYANDEKVLDPEGVAPVNSIQGDPHSGDSRIWPFKIMKGRQAYDSVNNTLVYTHVYGPKTDTAFWKNYDWAKSIQAGMEAAGKADGYSGEFGFVDTEMYWPITHMVAPAEQAMECEACHAQNGRLANIAGVFMPGTEDDRLVGLLGKLMVLAVALGVAGHALMRKFAGKKKEAIMAERCVKVYPLFERMWHWSQMVLIMILMFTGFGLNGLHGVLPFKGMMVIHTVSALLLLVIWAFATFWLFTTGTWKQFVPRFHGLVQVARYYAWGVFRGEEHPHQKVYWRKLNPLQVATYFGMKMFIFPAIWASGILYLTYNLWAGPDASGILAIIADIHVLAAYAIAAFVITHVYLLTLGHGFRAHVRPMIDGYEDIDLTPEQEAYLELNEPERLKDSCGHQDVQPAE